MKEIAIFLIIISIVTITIFSCKNTNNQEKGITSKASKEHHINEVLQNQENFNKGFFKKSAFEQIEKTGEVLLLIRIPYSAGSKHYFLFKNKEELNKLFSQLEAGYALTIIKEYKKITKKVVLNEALISELKNSYNLEQLDWLIIGFENNGKQWSTWVTNEEDLKECIEDEIGNFIILMEDPDWFNEEATIHAYVPDEDGVVRPGAY